MHNKDWHCIVNDHKTKRGEDTNDPTACVGRTLFSKEISLGLSSCSTTPTAYVREYLAPTNDICLHRNSSGSQNATIWLYLEKFYRPSSYEETKFIDFLKRDFIVIGVYTCLQGNLKGGSVKTVITQSTSST